MLEEEAGTNCLLMDRVKSVGVFQGLHQLYTTVNHAAVVMNEYFAKNQRTDSSCSFGNSGIVAYNDPSVGNCTYA
ncbi:carbohydrate-binding X8 domain-containing protein [Trifolium medium]|uniref:Carbohydrate-binding X8 domain-containing protein n=1 Tax=Trifolium medium TaxID=97028 RepID=A0A392M7G8_9FABA|nr:carbohydrate-binding X8 domain-containing protein [Trifolium medium]